MKARIILVLVILGAIAAIPTRASSTFSQVVVFGTSLSDPGNAFALRGGTNTPPDYLMDPLLVPAVPYAMGGHHFSNGATWIEQYARSRGLAGSARPAFASEGQGTNYAVAAARARDDGLNFNLPMQVDAFLGGFPVAPADALIVIDMGGNDIRDALFVYFGGGDGGPILQAAIISIVQNIQRLHAAGATEFLVWRAPDVGKTPALRSLGPIAMTVATNVTIAFNTGLDGALASVAAALPGAVIRRLDAFQVINDIVAHPGDYGLSNVSNACVMPNGQPFICESPEEYLFWDGIHPTKAAHAIVALKAAEVLGR